MLVGLPEFELASARTVEEACALLHASGPTSRVFAGGTDLFTKMKHRRLTPRVLVNIKGIPDLDRIEYREGEGLSIGPLVTIDAIEHSNLIAQRCPMLKQAAQVLGTMQIRNIGTLGGNLANASPSAEFAPPLLTLGASVQCRGRGGARRIAMEDFFVGPGKTLLEHDELITEVHIPDPPAGARTLYLKQSLRKMDIAVASAAVVLVMEDDACSLVQIALGAVAPTPIRARRAERMLSGVRLGGAAGKDVIKQAALAASEEASPIDDFRANAKQRREAIATLVGGALERLSRSPGHRARAA